MTKKTLVVALIVVIIILIGSWAIFTNKKTELITYKNSTLNFSFDYPSNLGIIVNNGESESILNINFSKDSKTPTGLHRTTIITFNDKMIEDGNKSIQTDMDNGVDVGEARPLSWSLATKDLLISKGVGYDCISDFKYLQKANNETCEIVDINGIRAFKIISWGGFASETSVLKYRFYVNGTWFEFTKSFNDSDKNHRSAYGPGVLNSILQGKTSNDAIKKEVDDFNKIISTLKFN
ncbi:MAG: hypothetical protein WAX44_02800 [Minisyncoccia bacterium]